VLDVLDAMQSRRVWGGLKRFEMAKAGKTETSIWQAPELGAEMLRGQFADFSYDVHTHDTACFALLTRGSIRIAMQGTQFVAREGDLYAIGADEPHAGSPIDENGWALRTTYVDIDFLRRYLGDERYRSTVTLTGPIIRDTVLSSLLHDVHRCSEEQGPALLRDEHYLRFAMRLFERHTRQHALPLRIGKEARAVQLARDFLDASLDRTVHLTDISDAAGLAPFRLFRAFSRDLGMTPHAYQRQARIRTAQALIRLGRPLSDVAAAAGFADQAHLTRNFRRIMGVTPGAYADAAISAGRARRRSC
jgi:AraC-like DNA-binding protein